MSAVVDEDVCLGRLECSIKVWGGDGSYDTKVPVNNVDVVHILDSVCRSQELILRH